MLRAVHRSNEARAEEIRRTVALAKRWGVRVLALEGAVALGIVANAVADEIAARSYEERASVATHTPVEHVRFLEHMLLDEYVANERGNTVEKAVLGFREFWPGVFPTVLPCVTNKDSQIFEGERGANAARAALAALAAELGNARNEPTTWRGKLPYLVVVGPSGDVKHAVAWLVTEENCFYSNTGAGAEIDESGGKCAVVRRFGRDMRKYVEFARTSAFDGGAFSLYVEAVKASGNAKTPNWAGWTPNRDVDQDDGLLMLADYGYDAPNGTYVSYPQRGGTCTYCCVLWLIGAVLQGEKCPGLEKRMKRRGLESMAKVSLVAYGDVEARDCMRVMEAAAFVYARAFPAECVALRGRIDALFSQMHSAMLRDGTRSVLYTKYEWGKACGAVTFDVTANPFAGVSDAAAWCASARAWIESCNAEHMPVVCVFVEKMRGIVAGKLVERARPVAAHSAAIVMFLAMYARSTVSFTGMSDETLGIALRCARMALSGAPGGADETRALPPLPAVTLPWVAAEFRALLGEATAKRPAIYDATKAIFRPPKSSWLAKVGDAMTSSRVGVFENNGVPPPHWAQFVSYMKDDHTMALNAALLYIYAIRKNRITITKPVFELGWSDKGLITGHGGAFNILKGSETDTTNRKAEAFYVQNTISLDWRAADSTHYLALSIADRVAQKGATEATEAKAPINGGSEQTDVTMHISLSDEGLTRTDVDELLVWADYERATWEGEEYAESARHRTFEYCAAKFLNQPTALAWKLDNLDALIAGGDGEAKALGLIRIGDFSLFLGTQEHMRYAVRKGLGAEMLSATMRGREIGQDAAYDVSSSVSTHRPTKKGGAKVHTFITRGPKRAFISEGAKSGLSVTQADRRLVFTCEGGARGTIAKALLLAGVESEQWKYNTGRYEIEANGARIVIQKSHQSKVTIGDYEVDLAPSEWSSLWYTTPFAAVFPVRRGGTRSLAVFVGVRSSGAAGGVTFGEGKCVLPSDEHKGRHFVVPLDAAEILPECTPAEARTLLSAFSEASLCGVRLMPMVAGALPACIYGDYMHAALGGKAASHRSRNVRRCLYQVGRKHAPQIGAAPQIGPWYGAIVYGEDERAAALARAKSEGATRLEFEAKGGKSASRVAFEGRSGKFVTERQSGIIERMKSGQKGIQVNMGVGKSAVIIPVLVLEMLERHDVVVVTQPAHLVPAAFRIVVSAVAARPFVGGRAVHVTTDARHLAYDIASTCKYVVICSSTTLQRWVYENPTRAYASQGMRAHIADEIDETSDPLKCEVAWAKGEPKAHYSETSALDYHAAVCNAVLGYEAVGPDPSGPSDRSVIERRARTKNTLDAVTKEAMNMRLNTQYGLVDEHGVYVAVPYKYVDAPLVKSRYRSVDGSAVLTALAVLDACTRRSLYESAKIALERAVREVKGAEAKKILDCASDVQVFLLHALLVALPQVMYYESEAVVAFTDTLGIAGTFAAFSGTMAFDLLVPKLEGDDARASFMPETHGGHLWKLGFEQDTAGNELVKKLILAARVECVEGAHTSVRAGAVISVLERAHGALKRIDRGQMLVVIDASGEFGLLGPSEFLSRARRFNESGLLEAEGEFVYYDHSRSRGTDATLDADAVGYVVIDWSTTTLTVAAQAMYRLRELEKRQSIVFVVCGAANVSIEELYAQLERNEKGRKTRLDARSAVHVLRAVKKKWSPEDFVFPIEAGDVQQEQEQEQAQKQEQEQEQQQKQEQRITNQCLSIPNGQYTLDPFVLYTEQDYKNKGLGVSGLLGKLRSAKLHVSPLIMTSFVTRPLERAFVVLHAADTIVLCTQIETLAGLESDTRLRGELSVYAGTGLLLRGERASPGLVLFGRYLCGDEILRAEQRELLAFLMDRYRGRESALFEVMSCLVATQVVPMRTGALGHLHTSANWHKVAIGDPPEVALIDGIMSLNSKPKKRTKPQDFGRKRMYV